MSADRQVFELKALGWSEGRTFMKTLVKNLNDACDSPADELQDNIERVRRRSDRAVLGLEREYRLAVKSTAQVVIDLAKVGWRFRFESKSLVGYAPPQVEPDQIRVSRRRTLHGQRDEQLRKESAHRFVKEMERRRFYNGAHVSIFDVMRDGRDLVRAIAKVRDGAEPSTAVEAYLQFVDEGAQCIRTGLLLQDIWRYFRHTWANPYQSVPGRALNFLVRDRATKFHSVIGIGTIANAAVQVRARDEFIGWEPESVVAGLDKGVTQEMATTLLNSVERRIGELYRRDLEGANLIGPITKDQPLEDVIKRLRGEERARRDEHHRDMSAEEYKTSPKNAAPFDDTYWEKQAETPLFRSKRAGELADLLEIQMLRRRLAAEASPVWTIRAMLTDRSGRQALTSLVRRIKAERVGTNIAELTVCGAIPPYGELVGGKLVAMLAASPAMVYEYKKRYAAMPSIIASSMAGRAIRRPAELVFIGTTSLYGVRPCQYDRISYPTPNGGRIRYVFIQVTEGWGTVQFGDTATKALDGFSRSSTNGKRVNYVFGEGANPKMRSLRDALTQLGFDPEVLLQHGLRKAYFGVSLARNVRDYLLGLDEHPDYFFDVSSNRPSTEDISQWWFARWVQRRLNRTDLLNRIQRHQLVCPIEHGARVRLPNENLDQGLLFDR